MRTWRVLYEDASGYGRYDEVQADDMHQAIWMVAQSCSQDSGNGKFIDIQDCSEE